MKLSVKPVPAARTLMRTSPVPGFGIIGSSASSKTSGPPNRDMRTCCHDMRPSWHIRLPLARSISCRRWLWMPIVAFGLRLRRRIDVAYQRQGIRQLTGDIFMNDGGDRDTYTATSGDTESDPPYVPPPAVKWFYLFTLLGRVLINWTRLVRLTRRPLCSDSDQVLQRSGMSRCANRRYHELLRRISIICGRDETSVVCRETNCVRSKRLIARQYLYLTQCRDCTGRP